MGINIYDGTQFKEITDLRRYADGRWNSAELRRYNGADWDLLWPVHFPRTVQYSMLGYVILLHLGADQYEYKYVWSGNASGSSKYTCNESLLFFPLDEIRQGIPSDSVISASLTLQRCKEEHGKTSGIFWVGYSLSGADPSSTRNTWDRNFTLAVDSYSTIARNAVKTVDISPQSVVALINGTADCLCLPVPEEYLQDTTTNCWFYPESISLSVTYMV